MKNDHYYSETPSSESRPSDARFTFRGQDFCLKTDAGVFSRGELDSGTRILLAALPQEIEGSILDLGCGWGPVGVCLGSLYRNCSVTFADINSRAIALAQENAEKYRLNAAFIQSDGFESIDGTFDYIITNPPIRAGKETIYRLFSDSAEHLNSSGSLYIVIRKQQGAPSAIKFLVTVFPQAEVIDKSGGYWVIRCRKE
ncbi:MAG: class I SAM-dependent methyltransferase [Clostridia bacterium]|nr:class I SAM-dependent methyltransferase [Clostridia bacterium]